MPSVLCSPLPQEAVPETKGSCCQCGARGCSARGTGHTEDTTGCGVGRATRREGRASGNALGQATSVVSQLDDISGGGRAAAGQRRPPQSPRPRPGTPTTRRPPACLWWPPQQPPQRRSSERGVCHRERAVAATGPQEDGLRLPPPCGPSGLASRALRAGLSCLPQTPGGSACRSLCGVVAGETQEAPPPVSAASRGHPDRRGSTSCGCAGTCPLPAVCGAACSHVSARRPVGMGLCRGACSVPCVSDTEALAAGRQLPLTCLLFPLPNKVLMLTRSFSWEEWAHFLCRLQPVNTGCLFTWVCPRQHFTISSMYFCVCLVKFTPKCPTFWGLAVNGTVLIPAPRVCCWVHPAGRPPWPCIP